MVTLLLIYEKLNVKSFRFVKRAKFKCRVANILLIDCTFQGLKNLMEVSEMPKF